LLLNTTLEEVKALTEGKEVISIRRSKESQLQISLGKPEFTTPWHGCAS
jgi:hypothetical protein